MTKLQLIFSVMGNIQQSAPTQDGLKQVHPQEVAIEVSKAYDTVVASFFDNPQFINNYDLDYFCKSYDISLQEQNGLSYATLPVNPIPLKYGLGIRLVKPKNSNVLISRMSESEFVNLKDLEAFCCSPVPFCYIDYANKRVVLQSNRTEYKVMDEITVKIVVKFTDLSDSDVINTPGGDYQLTEMVMKTMGLRPTDNTNDDVK